MNLPSLSQGIVGWSAISRQPNPNIELPPDDTPIPLPPDQEHGPPIETPPDDPSSPENQPDPPPIDEPNPDEPTRLV